jgi:cobalt/nickel transport system permease protein
MKNRFVERTLWSTLAFLRETLFAEEVAAKKGLLQSLDPRIRVVSLILLIGTVLFAKSPGLIAALYLIAVLLALLSGIRLGFFLVRTWFFIPIFSLFIALPSVFSFVTPGPVFFRLGALMVTTSGLWGASIFVGRVTSSVSFAVLLSLTSRHTELLKVLRFFGIPQLFVMVMGMTYRYIYLLLEILENAHRAVQSRVGRVASTGKGQRLVAWNIASLWMRSYHLSDQVYGAMRSRGYRGEPVVLYDFKTKPWDWFFLAAMLGLAVLLITATARGFL